MNFLSLLRMVLFSLLTLTIASNFTFCDAGSGDDSNSSSAGDGNNDGNNDDDDDGASGTAPSVNDIGIAWSTWGADGQPLPDSVSCTVGGGTPDTVTVSMGGDGLTPISYTLSDDGSNGDTTAGDGIYTIAFVQDLDQNALWAVDNIGHYLTCQAENSQGSDEMTWVTAGEVIVQNTSGVTIDTINVAAATSSVWGSDFLSGNLFSGNSFTVTDVPCGVYDLRACAGGGCVYNYGIVLNCGADFTWTITP